MVAKLPASITTDVVPSPTSASWLLAISTNVFAAGCTISSSWKWINWYIHWVYSLDLFLVSSKILPYLNNHLIIYFYYLHNCGTIIWNCSFSSIINDQLIHSSWSERGSDCIHYCLASIYIGDDLLFSLGIFSTLFQYKYLGLHFRKLIVTLKRRGCDSNCINSNIVCDVQV